MSSEVIATWVGAAATTASAIAAGMAWKAAHASSTAAAELTALEAGRRHEELTPRLTVVAEVFAPGNTNYYRLILGLDGPLALHKVDSMTISIRDDRPGRDQNILPGGEVTAGAVKQQIWGPLRFSPGMGEPWAKADAYGRSVTVTRPLEVGEGLKFQMERTSPPPWTRDRIGSDELWMRDMGPLLRLAVRANAELATEPWILPIELNLATAQVEGFHS